jgi:4-hydroxybenzoate polyprenyltransferase
LLVFVLIGSRVVILGLIVAALGIFYSHPKLNAKGTPIASSLPHLVGGLFHFLLGYAVFMAIDERGILIALFFALTFTAGHLNHEVRDFDLDSHNNARTNAVAFGKRPAFIAGLIVFTLAYLCLFVLGWFRFIPWPLALLALLFYPLHLYWSLRALRRQLNPETLDRFQVQYRVLYAIIGIGMLCSLFYW